MPKSRDIPFSQMQKISDSGVFVKRFSQYGKVAMRQDAHRDDYYIVAVLTGGSASVEIDLERIELETGNILIISPWQVHGKPTGKVWHTDGWIIAFSPEILSESEARIIEEYSISPHPLNPDDTIIQDIDTLCAMLERNMSDCNICISLASTVKSFVLSTLHAPAKEISGRYKTITLNLRKLLDRHLSKQKSPATYASMLNISEVYLNEAVKGTTGLSTGAYIRSRVIIQAKRQLFYTSLSVKEIAFTLGYEDYSYFSKLFKKSVGKSPSAYRKSLK